MGQRGDRGKVEDAGEHAQALRTGSREGWEAWQRGSRQVCAPQDETCTSHTESSCRARAAEHHLRPLPGASPVLAPHTSPTAVQRDVCPPFRPYFHGTAIECVREGTGFPLCLLPFSSGTPPLPRPRNQPHQPQDQQTSLECA